jgi:hypothetical protein
MKKYLLIVALAGLITSSANAACRIVGHSSDGEPLCETTSDGAGQPYTDDRRGDWRNSQWERERAARYRMQQREHYLQWYRGARHTDDMATGGTNMGAIGVVSPFVPGSREDQGWEAERKRRGLCGNDRRCLNSD